MATARQIERFFEGTGVQVEDMEQGRDGYIHLVTDDMELTILAHVMPNRVGDMTNPKLVIQFGKKGA